MPLIISVTQSTKFSEKRLDWGLYCKYTVVTLQQVTQDQTPVSCVCPKLDYPANCETRVMVVYTFACKSLAWVFKKFARGLRGPEFESKHMES